jgi:hypothetical protein
MDRIMGKLIRCLASLLAVAVFALDSPALSSACPFCTQQGPTLTKELEQAAFVVFGTLSNPQLKELPDGTQVGTTDMQIEEVLKDHPFLKGKKTLVLPRYLPSLDPQSKVKFLVYCDVFKDRFDPYHGVPCKTADIVKYLRGAAGLDEKDIAKRLTYFFDYLDHAEQDINLDAYREFANADYQEILKAVQGADRDKWREKLVKWLRDRETPTYRFGLYGYLLGLFGKPEDAGVLLELLNDPQRGLISGIDGVLAGLVTLKPKEGWQYVTGILGDPSKEVIRRYAALRTARFFWDYRSDLVARNELLKGVACLLDQSDVADFAIDDFRKWQQWQYADKIIELYDKKSYDVPIIRRAILRYALTCPATNPKVAAFIAEQRRVNPSLVKDVEELLKLETPAPKNPAKP